MSNWFHRNPLKATSRVKFDLGKGATNISARGICRDLADKRAELLKLICDPAVDPKAVLTRLQVYISLLAGFVTPPEGSGESESKLRSTVPFKWTDSVLPKHTQPLMVYDAQFEVCSMLFSVALWLTKHAAKVASSEEVSPEEAVDVYRSLRQAAGIFVLLKDQQVSKLSTPPAEGHDLYCDALETYINQCIAEAQEVTIGRAIELKHDPSLIAGLAKATSESYKKAALALSASNSKVVGKWLKYLQFKQFCYEACMEIYFAEELLKADKVGPAIAVMGAADIAYKKAVDAGKHYGSADGIGLSSKMAEHCFFRRLGQLVKTTRDKLERENGLIYHQKVPVTAPDCDLAAKFGLAEPLDPEIDFTPCEQWKEGYKGFDLDKILESVASRNKDKNKSKEKLDRDEPVETPAEKPIFSTDKDPKNQSGCVIS
ncbi:unnamed protein product [Calicophoron daubneyi]|uniref:BRO1 domain-containing protein n=1 Tax=Calicophoron daubneyi TaxID=300641 RepID=A0AAV2TTI5_CALDB